MLTLVEIQSLPRTAAFFDLDKTVIAKSSTLTFGKSFYHGGLMNRRAVLRTAYAQFVYLAGGADHEQMERMREYLSALCRGWNVQQVKEIVAETIHDLIDPIIYDEAASLIEQHHLAGRDVVIVSTSGAEVVEPIGEMIGADRVIATRMVVGEDGCYQRRDRVLRLRPDQGRGHRLAGRLRGLRPDALLRLQRLGHRPAHARGRRPSARRQPGPGAAQGGRSPATGPCCPSPARCGSSSACRPCPCPPGPALAVGGRRDGRRGHGGAGLVLEQTARPFRHDLR